jgi:glutamine cyclotransferase
MAVRHRGGKHNTPSSKKTARTSSSKNEAHSNGSSTGGKNNDYLLLGMVSLLVTTLAAAAIFMSTQDDQSPPNSAESPSSSSSSSRDVNEKTSQPPQKRLLQQHHQQQQTRYGSYKLLERVPHDTNAFTQGLEMLNETHYYESLGLYGESSVRMVELSTGVPVLETTMDSRWFGEGMCQYPIVGGTLSQRLIQITWKEKVAFIYDSKTLKEVGRIPFQTSNGEGWGITFDTAKNVLYVTDGTSTLHTWNVPSADDDGGIAMNNESVNDDIEQQESTARMMMSESRPRVEVFMTRSGEQNSIPIRNLNELEYDASDGTLLANVWFQDVILRIDPETGFVRRVYNLQSLYPSQERPPTADVLNGIALVLPTRTAADGGSLQKNEVWVTGKKWPWMYRIRLLDDDDA